MSGLEDVTGDHHWHPPVPRRDHPMHRGGCYCGWQCKQVFGESKIDQYAAHLAAAVRAHLADVAGRESTTRTISDTLRTHGMHHLKDMPADEFDCCANAAVAAFLQAIGDQP